MRSYTVGETLDGYTVVRDGVTGLLSYATLSEDGSSLVSTGRSIIDAPPERGVEKHLRISDGAARAQARAGREGLERETPRRPFRSGWARRVSADPRRGPWRASLSSSTSPTTWGRSRPRPSTTTATCSATPGIGNNGSVRDYFLDVSEGLLDYSNFVPTAYYRAANPKSYYTDPAVSYGTRARQLITEALDALDASGFDFSLYDADGNGTIDALNCFYAGNRWNAWA